MKIKEKTLKLEQKDLDRLPSEIRLEVLNDMLLFGIGKYKERYDEKTGKMEFEYVSVMDELKNENI